MSNRYSTSQAAVVDRDNRNMAQAGFAMSDEINALWAAVDTGAIGIQSVAADIDAICAGGACDWDSSTTPGSSLNFAILAGRARFGQTVVAVGAQTIALATASTNYVEVDSTGTLFSNTVGFTAGRVPLYTVATGASTYVPANVIAGNQRVLLTAIPSKSLPGALLTLPAQTKELMKELSTVTATTTFYFTSPGVAATLVAALFANSTAFATSNTDYWAWSIVNLGPGGAGATAMLAATAANSTQTTGGSALSVGIARSLTLHGAPGVDANLNTAANDVLAVTITKTGAPANLTLAMLRLDFTFQS